MKNLKKVLSLVLALAMALSLMTVAFAKDAADFNDYDEVNYKEAVDVMVAAGVFNGTGDGSNFDADADLTREQAAKIITYMLMGKEEADKLVTTIAPYADVAADRWSAGSIAYCTNEGILAGAGDGKFYPTAKLDGLAFSKMLLTALGYNAKIEKMTGSSWAINTAKLALSKDVDLDEGMKISLSKTLTREEAAQMAFNAMNANMVEYLEPGTEIKMPDGTVIIVGASKATPVEDGLFYANKFEDLEKKTAGESGRDDFGRPAHTWKYDGDKIGTYADTADYVLTLDEAYTAEQVLNPQELLRDLTDNDDLVANTKNINIYIDGSDDLDGNETEIAKAMVSGTVLEVFCDKDVVTDIIAMDYDMTTITKVDTKVTKADKEDGVSAYITLKGVTGKIKDTDFAGFDADTYVKDAYVLYVKDADATDNVILASELPETIEGKITATKDGGVRIGGTYYTSVKTGLKIGDEGTFYMNKAGQIEDFDGVSTKSENYAYIYNVTVENKANADGIKGDIVTVYYVTTDGTKASAVADVEQGVSAKDYYLDDGEDGQSGTQLTWTNNGEAVAIKSVVAYSINSDKEFVEETAKDTIGSAAMLKVDEKTAAGTDSATKFVFVYTDDNAVKASVTTGYKNVSFNTTAYKITNDDGVPYVFVAGENGELTSDTKYAVILDTKPTVEENEDGDTIYTYDVSIDGANTTLTFKSALTGLRETKANIIAYEMKDGYAEKDTDKTTAIQSSAKQPSAVNDDYVVLDKQYNFGTETMYTVTIEYTDDTEKEIESVTVSDGGTIDEGDWVWYTTNTAGDELDQVFVIEFIK